VKNFSLEEILTVMLAQLKRGERVHEGFEYDEQNQEGEETLNFAVVYDLMITNTFRKKKISFNYFQQWPTLEPDRFYIFILIRREERPTVRIVWLYLVNVLSHNTSFWLLTFVFRYAFGKIEVRKSQERNGGSSKWTFFRCLRIDLLQKHRGMQVKMHIVCGMRCRLIFGK
jgi:hypothetical protein